MSTEETVIPPTPEAPAAEVEQPEAPATAVVAAAPAAEVPKGFEAFDAWYAERTASAEGVDKTLDEFASGFTVDAFNALDPAAQTTAMAVRAQYEKRIAEAEKAAEEKVAKAKAEADKVLATAKAKEKQLAQRERAMFAAAAAAQDPGAPPEVDVFTKEGMTANARYLAQKAAWEAAAPMRERERAEATRQAWESTQETYPDLADPKVYAEFEAFMDEKNKGWDPKSGTPPRVSLKVGAELFFNARELAQARAERQARVQAEDRARATAATQIGRRAGGSPNGDALAIFNAKIKSDENDAWRYFAGLPEGDKARIQASFT